MLFLVGVFGEGIAPPEMFKEDARKKHNDTRHTFQSDFS